MSGLHVLYVDDDADIRTVVALSLSLDPRIVATMAGSAAEALAMTAGGTIPDVAVLDVMMPGMTGPALMERLHRHPATARLPVIFMTAKAREADVAAYRTLGAIGVILKPFDPLQLAPTITALVDSHRAAADADR